MDIDPHTIQQLLEKVRTQLRCPQCTKRVGVHFDSLKVMGESFAVFQMQCDVCSAYILLHATLAGTQFTPQTPRLSRAPHSNTAPHHNFSTVLEIDEKELSALRNTLKGAEGKFTDIFEENL